ncbi:mechanosensitive ion channel family protein [Deinococcus sp. UYEF24]
MNVSLNLALQRLNELLRGVVAALPNLLIAAVVAALFWVGARLLQRLILSLSERAGQPRGVALLFSRLASGLMVFLGVLVGLTIIFPSLTAASLLSVLGVGGVAIGFAFQNIFQNLLAGLLLLVTRPFKIGDQIVIGGDEGTIEDIQVRASVIRTYDNRQVVIPNSELFTNRVTVNTAYAKRRLSIPVGIGYGDDIDHAKEVLLRELAQVKSVLTDPPASVVVRELGDFSVNLDIRVWISPPTRKDVIEVTDEVYSRIKPALLAAGIDLPLPTQQVLFHDQTEVSDGDRNKQREGWPARAENPQSRQEQSRQERRATPAAGTAEGTGVTP